jgi:hypothetical protein
MAFTFAWDIWKQSGPFAQLAGQHRKALEVIVAGGVQLKGKAKFGENLSKVVQRFDWKLQDFREALIHAGSYCTVPSYSIFQ